MSREAFTVPMYGSTGPECFVQAAAVRRISSSTACGSEPSSVLSSVESAISSVPSPQLTGEERPTPRGSKVTTS